MNADFLSPDTKDLLERSLNDRWEWIERDHWVPTPASRVAMQWMDYMRHRPRSIRPLCMQIIGDGGSGKSALFSRYLALNPVQKVLGDSVRLFRPVLLVDCLDCGERGPDGLRAAIAKASWPNVKERGFPWTDEMISETVELQGTRVLLLDEAADILAAGPKLLRHVLTYIKRLNSRHGIHVVTASVHGLDHAFALDPQLQTRFAKIINLGPWDESDDFRAFLCGYERRLPFRERSCLDSSDNVSYILKETGGWMANVCSLIQRAALFALLEDADSIRLQHLEMVKANEAPPSRKKLK